MEETMIWGIGLAAEILLVVAVVFAVLLRRSRKAHQQLLAQLAPQDKHPAERAVAAEIPAEIPAESPVENPDETPDEIPAATGVSVTNELDQLLVTIDNTKLDDSVERLRQQLEVATHSLQRLASELKQESASSEQGHVEIASLQLNIQEMAQAVDSLQQSNAQLQEELRHRTQVVGRTFSESRDNEEVILQHAKKLRGDIVTLRDKLKNSEGDVHRLQSEKEALATEYAELNKEYLRIYSNVPK